MRRAIVVSVAVLVALCCLLAVAAGLGYYLLWPRAVARPVVLIRSPRYGERVQVGETISVHSIARDEGKVVRVEFWADGQLQEEQASTLPAGTSPFPLLAHWQPSSLGTHTLTVRAFNSQGGRAHASVNVEAFEIPDQDGDGVGDDADPCPDLPGPQAAGGCPDRDGDGIADYADACPDETGLPTGEGCPAPSEGDGDGDGLLDYADACPDEAGSPLADGCPDADGDGVADVEDACPHEPGWPERDGCPTPGDLDGDGIPDGEDDCPREWGLREHAGCPDVDGDGVPDTDDACPDEWGLPEHDGCPDWDGDSVPDPRDLCPDRPGPPESGCPDTGAGDSDGDGIPDDIDGCPHEPGPGPSGCPPPGGGEDRDGDGRPDHEEPPEGPVDFIDFIPQAFLGPFQVVPVVPNVEFEVLEFEVFDDYDEVYCYASLAGGDVEQYGPFEPLGDRRWDIAEYLGGENSRRLYVPYDEFLEVRVECGADVIVLGPEGGWGAHYDLGSFTRQHDRSEEEWDGHVIPATSDGGAEGHSFRIEYRICEGSCEEAAFPPPILTLFVVGEARLQWRWEGDRENIDGFKLYVNDDGATLIPSGDWELRMPSFEPPCGERYEFQMTAYSGDPLRPERESPRSNTVYWAGPTCPRTVVVTFETLTTTHEFGCRGRPIMGDLGANGQWLHFDGARFHLARGWVEGVRLAPDGEYSIEEILERIAVRISECPAGCPGYWAPPENYLTLSLDAHEDLTFGVEIYEVYRVWGAFHWEERRRTACQARAEIPADEIITGRYTASFGWGCNLTVEIQVLEP